MENQRIRLSKTMLKQGLLSLLEEKPLEKITVYALCERAQINRTTFYKYYGSQQDLLREICNDFFREIEGHMQADQTGLPAVLGYLSAHRGLFCTLSRTLPAQEFADALFAIPGVGEIFEQVVRTEGLSGAKRAYTKRFIYHGLFAVLDQWLTSPDPEPVEEMVDIIRSLRWK